MIFFMLLDIKISWYLGIFRNTIQRNGNLQTRLKIPILLLKIVTEYFLSSIFLDIDDLDKPIIFSEDFGAIARQSQKLEGGL